MLTCGWQFKPGDAMRRFIGSVALLIIMAILAPPALAQMGPPVNKRSQKATPAQIERKRQADEIDRKYKATLKKTDPDAPAKPDPWANMRGAGDGKK